MKKTTYKAARAATDVIQEATRVDSIFRPNTAQRKAKARFWVAWQDDPSVDIELMTIPDAQRLSGTATVGNWWPQPGFKEWFLNKDEHRHRLEYLYDLALDAAESILLNEDPKAASARVNVIKAVAELGAKFPTNQGVTGDVASWLKAIGQMDAVQLKALFEKQGTKAGIFLEKGDPSPGQLPEKGKPNKELTAGDEKTLDNKDGV